MMRRTLAAALVAAGVVAGCSFGGAAEQQKPAAGAPTGAPATAPATRPERRPNLANAFTQEIFSFDPKPDPKPSPLTQGWTQKPLKFEVQHPFDLKLADRYSYDKATDTSDVWVLATDKPHLPPPNKTTPRTELRLIDDTYKPNTGLHMLDCDLYIEKGSFTTITQVFGTGPMAMIVVDPQGTISDLRSHQVIGKEMNNKWFNWKVIHDSNNTGKGTIKIYIDDKLADGDVASSRQNSFYFKVGSYSRHGSDRSEVKIRNLKVWQKDAPPGNAATQPAKRGA